MHPTLFHRFTLKGAAPPEASEYPSGVRLERRGDEISIEIPFLAVEGVFYRIQPGELVVSSDLRLLYADDDTLDDEGIQSLLVLGGCLPPVTPYSEIRALLPGFSHQIHLKDGQVESHSTTTWSLPSPEDRTLPTDEQISQLRQVLDDALEAQCPGDDPIVLLSGGVDSAAIAARLAASGRSRTTLFHCSFGDDDEGTIAARTVASVLGLALEVVNWGEAKGYDVLDSAAARYTLPFVDTACVPAMVLADGVAARSASDRIVFDGTGADACFGKWSRGGRSAWLYALPSVLRHGFGEFYGRLHLYRKAGPTEKFLRLMRRSSQLGQLAFLVGQHPLAGIAVSTPPQTLHRISRLCDEWIQAIAHEADIREHCSLLYLGFICAGVECQKNQVLTRLHGFDLAYPYIVPSVADLAVSHARFWPGHTRPKNALRHLAAEVLPDQIAFRPKRGFVPPFERLLAHPTFLDHLEAATYAGAPLCPYVDSGFIARALRDLRSRRTLSSATYSFLWAVAFSNAWLSQVPAEAGILRRERKPVES